MNREELQYHLKYHSQVLQTEALEEAFTLIDRKDFVGEDYEVEAYEDYALPIGFDQTISKPTTVAFMLELLDLQKNEEVLDVGSGSGWTTALMAELVGEEGSVTGLEVIPELVDFGRKNLAKYDLSQASIEQADDEALAGAESYDKILVSASVEELPDDMVEKLRPGGILVIPVGDSIFKIGKGEDGELEESEFPGFSFEPLI